LLQELLEMLIQINVAFHYILQQMLLVGLCILAEMIVQINLLK
jgi:hypothetical protein